MIKVFNEISVEDFDAWCGGDKTLQVVKNCDKIDELDEHLEIQFPDGVSEDDLNDYLINEDTSIFEKLDLVECSSCGEWCNKEDMSDSDGDSLCSDCYYDMESECAKCGDMFPNSELEEGSEGLMCPDCLEEDEDDD